MTLAGASVIFQTSLCYAFAFHCRACLARLFLGLSLCLHVLLQVPVSALITASLQLSHPDCSFFRLLRPELRLGPRVTPKSSFEL